MSGGPDTPRAADLPASPAPAGVCVITVVRNGVRTLERTIRSVLAQTHPDLDYLIIDGDSTDGTRELIRRYEPRLRWISEPDRGLYDAMNKGVSLVSDPSRYVMFLNADDALASDDALERLLGASSGEDLVYGLVQRHDDVLDHRDIVGSEVTRAGLVTRMIPHQSMLCRRRLFESVGGFDLRYRIGADYDWLMRLYRQPDVTRRFAPVVVAVMARGGLSERRFARLLRERWSIIRRQGSAIELALYSAHAALIAYPRHIAQRVLRPLGLLNRARDAQRRLRDSARRTGAPPP